MLGKFLPVVMLLVGLLFGGGVGFLLRSGDESVEDLAAAKPPMQPEYVKLPSQFLIPILERGRVGSVVVMSLGVEVPAGAAEAILSKEPRLRDEFLRILFDHANAGGFRGTFTESGNLTLLRRGLLEGARKIVGDQVSDVLITDIARQDS